MISDNELRRFRATIEVSHEDGEAMLALPGIAGRLLEEIEGLRAQLHEFMGAGDVDLGRAEPASQRAHRLWERILSWPAMALPVLQNLIDETEAAKKCRSRGDEEVVTESEELQDWNEVLSSMPEKDRDDFLRWWRQLNTVVVQTAAAGFHWQALIARAWRAARVKTSRRFPECETCKYEVACHSCPGWQQKEE